MTEPNNSTSRPSVAPPPEPAVPDRDWPRYPVLSNRAIGWAAIVLIVVGVGLTTGLLIAFGDGQHPQQLEAIKTAGTIVVGLGGAAALWLAARRQRTSEIAVNQKDAEQRATEADAEARRITDLYLKAADQLGSDKAPVRLAGLYALERLAQDNPAQRQTIVNVLCAYLRMPYTPPREQPPTPGAPGPERTLFETSTQERQVRLTAQSILALHLHPGEDPTHPAVTFWPDIKLDLTGATLVDLDLGGCHLHIAHFNKAQFVGDTRFAAAWFAREARFAGAWFTGDARFTGARFASIAVFTEARFTSTAGFDGVQFFTVVKFDGARFTRRAGFVMARFASIADFAGARFVGAAAFEAQYSGDLRFDRDAPGESAPCWVRLDIPENPGQPTSWPAGWEVEPTTDRPDREGVGTWGHLVRTAISRP